MPTKQLEILRYTVSLKHAGAWATFGTRRHAEEWLAAHSDYADATIEDQQDLISEHRITETNYRNMRNAYLDLIK